MHILKTTPLTLIVFLGLVFSASPALAETHPFLFAFGSFTDPNGIAVDESSGDMYVADLGSNTVSKFDASGNPITSWGTNGVLDGSTTPAGPFAFPNEPGVPAAIAVDNSTNPTDPSAGDLYVLDAGHNVIDKFKANGEPLTPISDTDSPLGLGVDANGDVRVDVASSDGPQITATDVFDNAAENALVKHLQAQGEVGDFNHIDAPPGYGFAAGSAPGTDYALFSLPCGCVAKLGADGEEVGRVDSGATAVAAAVDPASGHVYVDDQSSVTEWDAGEMNGNAEGGAKSSGVLVLSFGALQLSGGGSGQGGIAANGASGDVYVSNPADGKVYVFGGDVSPRPVTEAPADVTRTSATLQGTVNPLGAPVTSCQFEYGTGSSLDLTLPLLHLSGSVPCVTDHGEPIGTGTAPVRVHADVSELQPGSLYHFRLVAANANGTSLSGGLFPSASAGFGIKDFEVAFLNEDGTPDTQAGSHPYEMITIMTFNTQVVQRPAIGDLRYAPLPMDNFKDVSVHLPPGVVGDPNAAIKKCTINELVPSPPEDVKISKCPAESEVGNLEAEFLKGTGRLAPEFVGSGIWAMVPPPGVAVQLAGHLIKPNAFIDVGVPAGRDSGAQAISSNVPVTAPVFSTRLTIHGGPPTGSKRPFLTLPSACNGPLTSRLEVDSYQNPGHFVGASSVTRNSAGQPGGMTGCAQLAFPPSIAVKPDTSNASSASGLTVGVHVSQKAALNPTGLAESALRDTTVALPPGVAINPSGAGGLEACTEGLAGFTGFSEFNSGFEPGDKTATFTPTALEQLRSGVSFCPDASKIGTSKLKTPLLENPLEGSIYLASQNQNPFGGLLAMYMMIEDPVSGTTVKIPFHVQLCQTQGEVIGGLSCQALGQIITTAHNTPELPFEDLELHFFGGERAPLTTPSRCGTYTTEALFTPWDGNGPVHTSSSFQIEHGPHGGPCPGVRLPFNSIFTGGSTNLQAGEFTPLTGTFSREDGEQQMNRVRFTLPPGLSGVLTGVKLCPEAQANAGTCGPESFIGETTVSAGVGSQPVSVEGGRVFLTEKYHGSPFGLSVVDPVKAGPFDLEHDTANPGQNPTCDCIVVRAKIDVNPITSALTITTNAENEGFAIPTFIDGIPVQIKKINFTTTRKDFQFNPTNCAKMAIVGSVETDESESHVIEVPFQVTNCATLGFAPKFSASTSGKTSKANGASLNIKLAYPKELFGSQANVATVKVELPKQFPSRLTTLQKACTAAVFDTNPANCPAASIVGHAKATTPILPVPVEGPAYFVSHGGEAFPSLIMVLQGYGVTIDLVGTTFISKAGITSSTFKSVPDVPVSTFALTLPQGKFSALTTNTNICKATKTVTVRKRVTVRRRGRAVHVTRKVKEKVVPPLPMPTSFTAQNGAVRKQTTQIAVTGCPKAKKTKKKASSSHGHGKRAATKR
jgi:DNA-binding beta-propeller fold protein YncE